MAEVKKSFTSSSSKKDVNASTEDDSFLLASEKVKSLVLGGTQANVALFESFRFGWRFSCENNSLWRLCVFDNTKEPLCESFFRSEDTCVALDGCTRLAFGIPFPKATKVTKEEIASKDASMEVQRELFIPEEPTPFSPPPAVEEKKVLKEREETLLLLEPLQEVGGAGYGARVRLNDGTEIPIRLWKRNKAIDCVYIERNWRPGVQARFVVRRQSHNGYDQLEVISYGKA